MHEEKDSFISQDAANKILDARSGEKGLDSIAKVVIPLAGGLKPETLPCAYSRLPETRRVLSDKVLSDLGRAVMGKPLSH